MRINTDGPLEIAQAADRRNLQLESALNVSLRREQPSSRSSLRRGSLPLNGRFVRQCDLRLLMARAVLASVRSTVSCTRALDSKQKSARQISKSDTGRLYRPKRLNSQAAEGGPAE